MVLRTREGRYHYRTARVRKALSWLRISTVELHCTDSSIMYSLPYYSLMSAENLGRRVIGLKKWWCDTLSLPSISSIVISRDPYSSTKTSTFLHYE